MPRASPSYSPPGQAPVRFSTRPPTLQWLAIGRTQRRSSKTSAAKLHIVAPERTDGAPRRWGEEAASWSGSAGLHNGCGGRCGGSDGLVRKHAGGRGWKRGVVGVDVEISHHQRCTLRNDDDDDNDGAVGAPAVAKDNGEVGAGSREAEPAIAASRTRSFSASRHWMMVLRSGEERTPAPVVVEPGVSTPPSRIDDTDMAQGDIRPGVTDRLLGVSPPKPIDIDADSGVSGAALLLPGAALLLPMQMLLLLLLLLLRSLSFWALGSVAAQWLDTTIEKALELVQKQAIH